MINATKSSLFSEIPVALWMYTEEKKWEGLRREATLNNIVLWLWPCRVNVCSTFILIDALFVSCFTATQLSNCPVHWMFTCLQWHVYSTAETVQMNSLHPSIPSTPNGWLRERPMYLDIILLSLSICLSVCLSTLPLHYCLPIYLYPYCAKALHAVSLRP